MNFLSASRGPRLGSKAALLAFAAALAPTAAHAHTGAGTLGGFSSGFTHPIMGLDHLLAMLAVGIWGAQMGGRRIWVLPVVFPLIMAVGGFLGAAGAPFPFVEGAIALSVLALGAAIAFKLKPPEWIAIILVGFFALAHGHAHGEELPQAADGAAYGIGFVLATGLIHLAGIGFGLLVGRQWHGRLSQACGAAMSLAGAFFLIG